MAQRKETLWSMSTTIREAERIQGFLKTASLLDGEVWDTDTQCKFQILLIQNHQYLNDTENSQVRNKLDDRQVEALRDWDKEMSYSMAESIFNSKKYTDPAMRGRQSMSPLVKLGLVYYDNKIIHISDKGRKLLNGEISFEEMILDSLLKYQFPNPSESGFKNWKTKPFINALRLIKRVNELCGQKGMKEKGVSHIEFGIFILSLRSYKDIDKVAQELLEFRIHREKIKTEKEKEQYTDEFIERYLSEFNNPLKNCREYTDNMIRYFRMTKYIYIRGKYDHTYVDLEPRRTTEINSILDNDNGEPREYSQREWNDYMGKYGGYYLPFESKETLSKIANEIKIEIRELENILKLKKEKFPLLETEDDLKVIIRKMREYRTYLQNLQIKQVVNRDHSKIDETIESLGDIFAHNKAKLAKRLSIELEKWTNVSMNILNDAILIKPNSPVGDDNEPTYTAPNGLPDIECYYQSFNSICEVTMLTGRDQWYNEGQPVMRHLRAFEVKDVSKPSYCLFVAPKLHKDTINTFYIAVRYEYEGEKQKIIPITIPQLSFILNTIKKYLENNKSFSHNYLHQLYENCVNMNEITSSNQWLERIDAEINKWCKKLLA